MKPTERFGSLVFNDAVMQERLPKAVYKSLHETIANGKDIDPTVADVVASDALHALVPADDRRNRRKARIIHQPGW